MNKDEQIEAKITKGELITTVQNVMVNCESEQRSEEVSLLRQRISELESENAALDAKISEFKRLFVDIQNKYEHELEKKERQLITQRASYEQQISEYVSKIEQYEKVISKLKETIAFHRQDKLNSNETIFKQEGKIKQLEHQVKQNEETISLKETQIQKNEICSLDLITIVNDLKTKLKLYQKRDNVMGKSTGNASNNSNAVLRDNLQQIQTIDAKSKHLRNNYTKISNALQNEFYFYPKISSRVKSTNGDKSSDVLNGIINNNNHQMHFVNFRKKNVLSNSYDTNKELKRQMKSLNYAKVNYKDYKELFGNFDNVVNQKLLLSSERKPNKLHFNYNYDNKRLHGSNSLNNIHDNNTMLNVNESHIHDKNDNYLMSNAVIPSHVNELKVAESLNSKSQKSDVSFVYSPYEQNQNQANINEINQMMSELINSCK